MSSKTPGGKSYAGEDDGFVLEDLAEDFTD